MNKKILIFAVALIFLVSSISIADAWCFLGIGNSCVKGKRVIDIGKEVSNAAREEVKPVAEQAKIRQMPQVTIENRELPNGTIIQIVATGDTIAGVTVTGVDANGNSCTVEYQGLTYTISEFGIRVFEDEGYKIIGVLDAIPIDDPASPDYCKLVLGQGDLVMAYATGETMSGVTLTGVDANGDSCTVEYQGLTYTILENKLKIMPDEGIIAVQNAVPIDDPASPDYCRLWLYGVSAEDELITDEVTYQNVLDMLRSCDDNAFVTTNVTTCDDVCGAQTCIMAESIEGNINSCDTEMNQGTCVCCSPPS